MSTQTNINKVLRNQVVSDGPKAGTLRNIGESEFVMGRYKYPLYLKDPSFRGWQTAAIERQRGLGEGHRAAAFFKKVSSWWLEVLIRGVYLR